MLHLTKVLPKTTLKCYDDVIKSGKHPHIFFSTREKEMVIAFVQIFCSQKHVSNRNLIHLVSTLLCKKNHHSFFACTNILGPTYYNPVSDFKQFLHCFLD